MARTGSRQVGRQSRAGLPSRHRLPLDLFPDFPGFFPWDPSKNPFLARLRLRVFPFSTKLCASFFFFFSSCALLTQENSLFLEKELSFGCLSFALSPFPRPSPPPPPQRRRQLTTVYPFVRVHVAPPLPPFFFPFFYGGPHLKPTHS